MHDSIDMDVWDRGQIIDNLFFTAHVVLLFILNTSFQEHTHKPMHAFHDNGCKRNGSSTHQNIPVVLHCLAVVVVP